MILVQAEISVQSIAEAIGQLRDYQVNELAAYLAQDDIRQAVALEAAIDSAIKEFK